MDARSLNILEKGLNLAIVSRRIPLEDLIFNIEYSIRNLTSKCAEEVRKDCVIMLRKEKLPSCNISKEEQVALINLKKNKSIKIMKGVKEKTTVILDEYDYHKKCLITWLVAAIE